MSIKERPSLETLPKSVLEISDKRPLDSDHQDEYGKNHVIHTAPQIWFGDYRVALLTELQEKFGITFEITDPANAVRTITAHYKQQLFPDEDVNILTALEKPDPQQETPDLTFRHKITKDENVAIIATVTCNSDNANRKELQSKRPQHNRWEYLNQISIISPVKQNGAETHHTDSQHILNDERMRIFKVFGMELFGMAQKHGLRGFVRYMEVEYKRQPRKEEVVEITTDLYVENRRKKLRYYQQIKTMDGEVITEAIFDCVLVDENGEHTDIPKHLTQPFIDARKTAT